MHLAFLIKLVLINLTALKKYDKKKHQF